MEQPPFWGITAPGVQGRRRRGAGRAAGVSGAAVAATLGLLVLLLGAAGGAALVGRLLRQPEAVVRTPAVRAPAPRAPVATPSSAGGRIVAAGRTAVDDGLAFRVGSAVCGGGQGAAGAGQGGLESGADKVFCVVELRIRNVGTAPRAIDPAVQVAFDQGGRRHQPSSATAGAVDAGASLGSLDPGASVSGTVIYEVAAGTSLHHLELHGSRGSAGVLLAV